MLFIDSFYLNLLSHFFNKKIKKIQGSDIIVDKKSIVLCYLLLTLGFYYFIIYKKSTPLDAFLLGLLIYGVYETTNKAIFSNWDWDMVIIDSLWGGILFLIVNTVYNEK